MYSLRVTLVQIPAHDVLIDKFKPTMSIDKANTHARTLLDADADADADALESQ